MEDDFARQWCNCSLTERGGDLTTIWAMLWPTSADVQSDEEETDTDAAADAELDTADGSDRRSTVARRLTAVTVRFRESLRSPAAASDGSEPATGRSRVRDAITSLLRGLQAVLQLLRRDRLQQQDI